MTRFEIYVTFDKTKSLKFYAKITDKATSLSFENSYDEMGYLADWIANTVKLLEKGRPS